MRKLNKIFAVLVAACLTVTAAFSASAEEAPTTVTEAATVAATEAESQGGSPIIDKAHEVTFTITAQTAEYAPISGVGYTLYYYSADLSVVPNVNEVDKESLEKIEMPLTDENGIASVTLSANKQGVYIVSCTVVPETVKTASDDFVITLPYTENGEVWTYDLNASPKLLLAEVTEPETETTTQVDETTPTQASSTPGSSTTANTAGKGAAATGDLKLFAPLAACLISVAIVYIAHSRKQKRSSC